MKRDVRLIAIVVLALNTALAVARDHALISALAGAATAFAIAFTFRMRPAIRWPWATRPKPVAKPVRFSPTATQAIARHAGGLRAAAQYPAGIWADAAAASARDRRTLATAGLLVEDQHGDWRLTNAGRALFAKL